MEELFPSDKFNLVASRLFLEALNERMRNSGCQYSERLSARNGGRREATTGDQLSLAAIQEVFADEESEQSDIIVMDQALYPTRRDAKWPVVVPPASPTVIKQATRCPARALFNSEHQPASASGTA